VCTCIRARHLQPDVHSRARSSTSLTCRSRRGSRRRQLPVSARSHMEWCVLVACLLSWSCWPGSALMTRARCRRQESRCWPVACRRRPRDCMQQITRSARVNENVQTQATAVRIPPAWHRTLLARPCTVQALAAPCSRCDHRSSGFYAVCVRELRVPPACIKMSLAVPPSRRFRCMSTTLHRMDNEAAGAQVPTGAQWALANSVGSAQFITDVIVACCYDLQHEKGVVTGLRTPDPPVLLQGRYSAIHHHGWCL
jgi:hypothetical protein